MQNLSALSIPFVRLGFCVFLMVVSSCREKIRQPATETWKIKETMRVFSGLIHRLYKNDSTQLRRFYTIDQMASGNENQDSVLAACLEQDPDFLYTLIDLSASALSHPSQKLKDHELVSLADPAVPYSRSLVYFFKAQMALTESRRIESNRWIDSALALDSTIASYHRFKGKLEQDFGWDSSAISSFRKDASFRKKKFQSYQILATCYLQKGDTTRMITHLDLAIEDLEKEKKRLITKRIQEESAGQITDINLHLASLFGMRGEFNVAFGDVNKGKNDLRLQDSLLKKISAQDF